MNEVSMKLFIELFIRRLRSELVKFIDDSSEGN